MSANALREAWTALYQRVEDGTLAEKDFITIDELNGDARSHPSWIQHAIEQGVAAQPDVVVFSRFRAQHGWILDIGAHWGYSATSLRAGGTDCQIVSFEALEFHRDCLEMFKSVDPLYDYRILALTETLSELELLTPCVNGVPLFGVSSTDGKTLTTDHAELGIPFLGPLFEESDTYEVRLLKSVSPAKPLDTFWSTSELGVTPLPQIAAIKLDVEGHEAQVITGGMATITRDKPFFMIEGANRVPDVAQLLQDLGYQAAALAGDQIVPTTEMISGINGCWFHPDHLDLYREMNLIASEEIGA
jgi:hypothetical protein